MNMLKPSGVISAVAMLTMMWLSMPLAMATDSERHQLVRGMDVYLGVIPSQLASGVHPGMHSPRMFGRHEYHVLVALFDSKTGNRITNAIVNAKVSDSALTEETKPLELMQTNGVKSFGNFFLMSMPGQYKISVAIKRPDMDGSDTANFIYLRPRD